MTASFNVHHRPVGVAAELLDGLRYYGDRVSPERRTRIETFVVRWRLRKSGGDAFLRSAVSLSAPLAGAQDARARGRTHGAVGRFAGRRSGA
jgi:hypothetical protein